MAKKTMKAKKKAAPKKRSPAAENLVIVESPGKIRTIKKILGKGYEIKASFGHVRDLPGKNTSGGRRGGRKKKSAANGNDEEIVLGVAKDFTPRYVQVESKAKTVGELKKAAKKAERVWLCPDPDREGEAIAWHLFEVLNIPRERVRRVSFDEITPRAIRAAFQKPRRIDIAKVNAQQARRVLDRLVGYKLSPLLWEKFVRGLSAGRVQSPAVRLIAEREREISAFGKEEYWTVRAVFSHTEKAFDAVLRALDGMQMVCSADDLRKYKLFRDNVSKSGIGRQRLENEADANAAVAALKDAAWRVAAYEVRKVLDRPYPPFATSQLQQAAANRLGFDADRTMRVAQRLYEGVNLEGFGHTALITYMRTDSFRIAHDALVDCRKVVSERFGPEYLPDTPRTYRSRKGAQEAHECIRPTDASLDPETVKDSLLPEQYRLYKLIWQRFVACQMKPAVFDAAVCDLAAEGQGTRHGVFRATGRVLKFDGWLRVYGGSAALTVSHLDVGEREREKGDEPDAAPEEAAGAAVPRASTKKIKNGIRKQLQTLPAMKTGEAVELCSITPRQHFTQPPPRYTQAALVKALEREGIGRPSTYASIVSTIQSRNYVEKIGEGGRGAFRATALGMAVTDRLVAHFPLIVDLGFTREMEAELDKIEDEKLNWKDVLREFNKSFSRDLEKARREMPSDKEREEPSDVPCPECGSPMVKRLGRFGEYLRCTKAPDCKTTLNLDADGKVRKREAARKTGLVCDLCGAPVVKTIGRFGPFLCCSRYQTKECTFTMRLTKDGRPVRKFAPLPTELSCGKCKKPMVVRVSARGKKRKAFLSCSNFPRCRAAEELPEDMAAQGEEALRRWEKNNAENERDWEIMRKTMSEAEAGTTDTDAVSANE